MEELVQAVRVVNRKIRLPKSLSCEGEGKYKVPKDLNSSCQEKPLARRRCPYRKPTQVGEKRILRRAEELSLRNSAK